MVCYGVSGVVNCKWSREKLAVLSPKPQSHVILEFEYSKTLLYGIFRQFALSLRKGSPHIFFKFNPLSTDTLLIQTLSMVPSVSVLMGFDNYFLQ